MTDINLDLDVNFRKISNGYIVKYAKKDLEIYTPSINEFLKSYVNDICIDIEDYFNTHDADNSSFNVTMKSDL